MLRNFLRAMIDFLSSPGRNYIVYLIKNLPRILIIIAALGSICAFLFGLTFQGIFSIKSFSIFEMLFMSILYMPVYFLAAIFFLPILYPLIADFFFDVVAESVEKKHYPNLKINQPEFKESLKLDIKFMKREFVVRFVIWNVVSAPLYAIMPFLAPIIFWCLNGWLIGRSTFEALTRRYAEPQNVMVLYRDCRFRVFCIGVLLMMISTIPLLQFVVPFLGVAWMLHFYHSLYPIQFAQEEK